MQSRPASLGDLRPSGYVDKTVKDELRASLLERLARGRPLFSSIVGWRRPIPRSRI